MLAARVCRGRHRPRGQVEGGNTESVRTVGGGRWKWELVQVYRRSKTGRGGGLGEKSSTAQSKGGVWGRSRYMEVDGKRSRKS